MNQGPDDCKACGAARVPGDWRFCGTCGAELRRVRPPKPTARRALVVAIGLLAAALVVPLARFVAPAVSDPPAEVGVEVPAAPPAALPAPANAVRPCGGGGCDFWTADVGAGASLAVGDAVYHLAGGQLRAVSPLTGHSRWQRPVTSTAGRAPRDATLHDVGGAGPVTVVDGGVVRSWTPEGRVHWEQDLGDRVVADVQPAGDGLLVRARRAGSTVLVRLDGGTGQPAWELAVERVVALADDRAPVVLLDPVTLAAVDPFTGVPRWTRAVRGHDAVGSDGRHVAVASGRGIELLAASDGERLATSDHPVAYGSWVRVHGALVAVFSPEPLEAGRPPRTGVLLLGLDGVAHGRWHGASAGVVPVAGDMPDERWVVVATRAEGTIEVEAFASDGSRRWTFTHDVPRESCCWRLQGLDDGSVLLAPRRPGGGDALRLEGTTGTRLERFRVRGDAGDAGHVSWHGTLAVHRTGAVTRLMGPRGTLELPGDVRVVTGPRPIILGTADGLLRIDERLVMHTGEY